MSDVVTPSASAAPSIGLPEERTYQAAPVAEHALVLDGDMAGAQEAEIAVESAPVGARRESLHAVLGRVAYWSPVLVALIVFAQVSFLGLRPALAEAGRLSEAETMLNERQAQAVQENRALARQLEARQDPVFRERQRRLRQIELAPAVAPVAPVAELAPAATDATTRE